MFFRAIFLRERLIKYYVERRATYKHHALSGKKYSIRELLIDITQSNSPNTDNDWPSEEKKEAELEASFPLKHDSLERFISRTQYVSKTNTLDYISNFLRSEGYVGEAEDITVSDIDGIKVPIHVTGQSLNRQLFALDGEYVALEDRDNFRIFSSLLFRRDERARIVRAGYRTVGKVIDAQSDLDRLIRFEEVTRKTFNSSSLSGLLYWNSPESGDLLLFDDYGDLVVIRVQSIEARSGKIILDIHPKEHLLWQYSKIKPMDLILFLSETGRKPASPAYSPREVGTFGGRSDWEEFIQSFDDGVEIPDFLRRQDINIRDKIKKRGEMEKEFNKRMSDYFCVEKVDLNAAFCEAARNGDVQASLQFLLCGADINCTEEPSGNTALHLAASNRAYDLYAILSGRVSLEGPVVSDFLYTLRDCGLSEAAASSYLKAVISRAPVSRKNSQGLTPAAYIGPINLHPENDHERAIFDLWKSAVEFEGRHYSARRTGNSPSTYLDYALENEVGGFMPFLRETPPRL